MEQVFEHYDKDTLKMAMLKHEETFRQQVHGPHQPPRRRTRRRPTTRRRRRRRELELTFALGDAASAKKRYSRNEHHSPGQSFSSSSTESDVLVTGVRDADAASPPYHHKRRPGPAAAFDVVQVDDGAVQAAPPPPPLLFHWLSLRMA
ncbi:hypothetical protein OsJ_12683 [Oryza sativa Japonica Group]|uniref:Uncharacterized protein n=1 Tax=Oryza sativa subsp. japonica TaxID=39947 RepID=B9F5U4_ORYSJ|nr:hypothetical protein OsJ_12683 [Oryza sativa Japonica Group]